MDRVWMEKRGVMDTAALLDDIFGSL